MHHHAMTMARTTGSSAPLVLVALLLAHAAAASNDVASNVRWACEEAGDGHGFTVDYCVQTLMSDPRIGDAYHHWDMAAIALDLSTEKAAGTMKHGVQLLNDGPAGDAQECLNYCYRLYGRIVRDGYGDCHDAFLSSNYDDASKCVDLDIGEAGQCKNGFAAKGVEWPLASDADEFPKLANLAAALAAVRHH